MIDILSIIYITKFSPEQISCKLPGFTTSKLVSEYNTLNNLSTIGLLKFLAQSLYLPKLKK